MLYVYLYGKFTGTLNKTKNGNLSFVYDKDYIGIDISYSMPFSLSPYKNKITKSFFSNLLPEEDALKNITKMFKISSDDTFNILNEIGGECTGSIIISKDYVNEIKYINNDYTLLSKDEIYKTLIKLSSNNLVSSLNNRLSIAGAQPKRMFFIKDDNFYKPNNNSLSNCIIKPYIDNPYGINDISLNEYYCMKLSESIGLKTAKCSILTINNKNFYLTHRYDRYLDLDKNITKAYHQEDFCQILGLKPSEKYQGENNTNTLNKMFKIINEYTLSGNMAGIEKIYFFKLIIFNFIIGNNDAHCKNYSIIHYEDGKKELSPGYDLISTEVYNNSNYNKSLNIKSAIFLHKNKNNSRYITLNDLVKIGTEYANFSEKYSIQIINEIINNIQSKKLDLSKDLTGKYNNNIFNEINVIIDYNIKKIQI